MYFKMFLREKKRNIKLNAKKVLVLKPNKSQLGIFGWVLYANLVLYIEWQD